MKPFNLAEAKIAERTYCKEQLGRRLKIVALLAILTLGALAVSYGCKVSVRGKASKLRSELADVQGRCITIKKEIAVVEAKSNQRKWQAQLAGSSKRWLGVLNAVLSHVPGDLWLSRLESSESDSSVSIEGQAASFISMSEFIGSIRSSPSFSDVRINSTRVATVSVSKAGVPGRTVVDFSLQAKLKSAGGADAAQAAPRSQAVPVLSPAEGPPVRESP